MRTLLLFHLVVAVVLAGCTLSRQSVERSDLSTDRQVIPADSLLRHRIYLIGDVGASDADGGGTVLRLLRAELEKADERSTVVFLGDNAPRGGLPDSLAARGSEAEARLAEQMLAVAEAPGNVVFIPGHQDWGRKRGDGAAAVRRQEAFVESGPNERVWFLPDSAHPGPVELELDDQLTLVVLDTEWWLYDGSKPLGGEAGYDLSTPLDVLTELDDVVRRRRKDDLIVVGHHPVFSNGPRAGRFPLLTHLFPLASNRTELYVPMPVAGSLYVLYHRYVGLTEDFASTPYRQLRESLSRIFAQHENLVYAAGHEHSLQYFPVGTAHYIVSGAGSEATYVAPGARAGFAASRRGFAVLDYYEDGQMWLSFIGPDDTRSSGQILYRSRLREAASPPASPVASGEPYPDLTGVKATLAAGPQYAAGPLQTFFSGREHRTAWTTPITAPALDVGKTAGGLVPIRRGGGQQTTSIRFRGGDDHEYVLRSIDKDALRTVPTSLHKTFAADFVQDQIASLFPYGALVATELAGAAGILRTKPRVVFVPDDPRLEPYRELVSGQLMLFDVHGEGELSDVLELDNAREVVSTPNMNRHMRDDNDDRIHQREFARARLLDLLISDWDRGPDQWRWAEYDDPDGKGTLYRPIPRDRDFAFNRMDGLFPTLAPYVMGRYEDFGPRYGSLRRLTTNGLSQDRRFTNALTLENWLEEANILRSSLTDERIDDAVRALPPEIHAKYGPWMSERLRVRRDKLPRIAERFYRLNNRIVDVVGSDKHEFFEVLHFEDSTSVVVYKTDEEGAVQQAIYRRTFLPNETGELRLYGLDGNDRFVVDGETDRRLRVIGVGGPGDDTFVERPRDSARRSRTRFYDDTSINNTWEVGRGTRVTRSTDPNVNSYGTHLYSRNETYPQLFFGTNRDDGVFLGGGVQLFEHGFRKQPYARSHRVLANASTRTGAFNVSYDGHFVGIAGGWDGILDAWASTPNTVRNYYGLGNETVAGVTDFRARLSQVSAFAGLMRPLGPKAYTTAGPVFMLTAVREAPDLPDGRPATALPPDVLDPLLLAGVQARSQFEDVDDPSLPQRGFRIRGTVGILQSLAGTRYRFGTVDASSAFYGTPISKPRSTLGLRIGGGRTLGDAPFFETQTLGGKSNLRGYRSNRFSGRSSLYVNTELRVQLFRFATYLTNGEAGLLGFWDTGRVWAPGESSRIWHHGYGGGVWFRFFERVVVSGTAAFSKEDRMLLIGTSFFY